MFIAVKRLLIKARQPTSRADELIALGLRLRDELARDIDDEDDERMIETQGREMLRR